MLKNLIVIQYYAETYHHCGTGSLSLGRLLNVEASHHNPANLSAIIA
jgi:hypothetical protein